MKINIQPKKVLAGCMLFLLISANIMAQTTVRMFYYAPTDIITANFTGVLASFIQADFCHGTPTGYSYVVLDINTAETFRRIAPPRLKVTYDDLTDDNSVLHGKIIKINTLSSGLVTITDVFMVDDRTGLSASDNCKCEELFGNIRGVWPCADNNRNSTRQYYGYLFLGELAADQIITNSPGGNLAWEETILHEFTHTQFACEYINETTKVHNKWGANGVNISYGGDAGHWIGELLGDQQMPLEEGIASHWTLWSNQPSRGELWRFLNNTNYRFFLGSHSNLTGTANMWNAPHYVYGTATVPAPDPSGQRIATITRTDDGSTIRKRLTGEDIQTGARYELRIYKWLDVPGEYVFNNELMAEGFVHFADFAFSNTNEVADNWIFEAVKALTVPNQRLRYPAYLANLLANGLEAYARTPEGSNEESAGTLTSSMFVYALYDIMTHFGITEEALQREFRINFESYTPTPKPLAYEHYWSHREAIKQLACPYLEGNNCLPDAGEINILGAVTAVRDYFRDPSRILR